jgi:CubicO group peptidase (beta-lactamase class C family)
LAQPRADDVEARVERVRNGLLLPVAIAGRPPQPLSLAERMASLKVPGVSVAVIDGGRVAWSRGFGVTLEGGAPVTPATLFQAASISKPVAAMAALRLVQEGTLDLDADVNRSLKTWKVPANELTEQKKVTVRGLLSHTAGLTIHGFPGYAAGAAVPSVVQVLDGEKPANTQPVRVDIVPGSRHRYSGGGYTVLQQLLADVTGEAFPELMQRLVLGPIGMSRSTYQQPLPAARRGEAAQPHDGSGKPIPGGPHTYPEMAAAGLWTTPEDLARFAIELQRALAGDPKRVLSPATAQAMLTPPLGSYALGLGIDGSGETLRFAHGGSNAGFQCFLVAYANTGRGAVIMTSGQRGGALAQELVRAIAREYGWPDFKPRERVLAAVDPAAYDRYAGTYEIRPGNTVEVRRQGDALLVLPPGQPARELLPEAKDRFFTLSQDLEFRFEPDALVIRGDGQETRAKKIR